MTNKYFLYSNGSTCYSFVRDFLKYFHVYNYLKHFGYKIPHSKGMPQQSF